MKPRPPARLPRRAFIAPAEGENLTEPQRIANVVHRFGGRVDWDGQLAFREMPVQLDADLLARLRSHYPGVIQALTRRR